MKIKFLLKHEKLNDLLNIDDAICNVYNGNSIMDFSIEYVRINRPEFYKYLDSRFKTLNLKLLRKLYKLSDRKDFIIKCIK